MITRQFTRLLRPKRTIPRSSPRFLPLLPFHSESTSLVSSSPSTATRQIHYSPILRPPSSSPITQAAQPSTTPHPPVKENIQAGLGIDQVPLETIPGPITPLTRYDQLVQAGALRDDEHQRTIITKLETLHDELREYNPPPVPSSAINNNPSSSWFSKLFSPSSSKNSYDLDLTPPKGLYLHGDVGCGKTMLMDLFYSTLPPHLHDSRRRIHFHAFMVDVFRRVHAIKNGLSTEISSPLKESITEVDEGTREQIKDLIPHVRNIERQRVRSKRAYNPMEGRSDERPIGVEALHGGGLFSSLFPSSGPQGMSEEAAIQEAARELAEEGRVLCFDEFQVTDIVTAMILRGLFERLMQLGVVCVITSNRHPDELYKNGIQRQSFVPCIDLIKEKFEIVDLDSKTDYRKLPRALSKVYFHPLTEETNLEFDKLFRSLALAPTPSNPSPKMEHNHPLTVWGRQLLVPECAAKVARFPFMRLCGEALSSADYLEITQNFDVVFVEKMPVLGKGRKDLARRFITFIDACYENKTRLFISSEGPIFEIFGGDKEDASAGEDVSAHMRSIMDDLGLSHDVVKSSAMFSGDEEFFAWARCVSRLTQMGTREWANTSR